VDELRTPNLREAEHGVERRIRELRDSGALSGLPGEGRPLPPDPDDGAGDAWAARHVLRTSGSRPEWADLRRDIGERRGRIVKRLRAHLAWLDRRAQNLEGLPAERIVSEAVATAEADVRVRAEARAAVVELNALIDRHNLLVTSAQLHLRAATLEELLTARARRA
jgi:hypothetical protein